MRHLIIPFFAAAASVLSGCDAGTNEERNKTLEVIIESSETNDDGQVMFWDDYSDGPVLIQVSDVNGKPLADINVRFLDGSGFEGFVLADPNSNYGTSFQVYPHNSTHSITMHVMDSEPVVRKVMRNSLEGRALQNFERDYLKPRAIYLGRKTPDELNTQTRNKLFLLGSFLGTDTAFNIFTETVARLSDLTGWDEPEFYDVYEVLRFDGMTTSLRHLVPVDETTEEMREVERERNSSLENTKIAFVSERDGKLEIYIIDSDGSNQRNLAGRHYDSDPSWSPDGNQIIFISTRAAYPDQICIMGSDGSNQRKLTNAYGYYNRPSWSPSGSKIAFSWGVGGEEIYVMNSDGSNQRNLTNTVYNVHPSWSPDGKQITFASKRDGNWEIYVMNSDGSNQTNITNSPRDDITPSWSPNGKQIAFASKYGKRDNWEIYVMNANGSNQRNLTNNPTAHEHSPSWSPDGKQIAFDLWTVGKSEISIMDSDGSNQRKLTNGSRYEINHQPSWSPFLTREQIRRIDGK